MSNHDPWPVCLGQGGEGMVHHILHRNGFTRRKRTAAWQVGRDNQVPSGSQLWRHLVPNPTACPGAMQKQKGGEAHP